MPSTSQKQHNFMAAVAHSPSFAKKAGVPTSVGKDFTAADQGKKFDQGGYARKAVAKALRKPGTGGTTTAGINAPGGSAIGSTSSASASAT